MPTSNSKKNARRKARTQPTDQTPFSIRKPTEEGDAPDDGGEQSEKEKVALKSVARKVIQGIIDYMDPAHYLTSITEASKSGRTHAFMITAAGSEPGLWSVQCDQLMRLDSTCEQLVQAIMNNTYTQLLVEEYKVKHIGSGDKEYKFISRVDGDRWESWVQDWATLAKQHLNTCDDAFTRSAVMTAHQINTRETMELMSLWQGIDASTELYTLEYGTQVSCKAVEFRKQIYHDREIMNNYHRKKFNRTLSVMRQETTAANEDDHPGYSGQETYKRVCQVHELIVKARVNHVPYREGEIMDLLNDIISADNSKRQATAHINMDDYNDYVTFKDDILAALQSRGYVPEKFYMRSNYTKERTERDASHGGNDRDKRRAPGRQRQAHVVIGGAEESDSDGRDGISDGDSVGFKPQVGIAIHIDKLRHDAIDDSDLSDDPVSDGDNSTATETTEETKETFKSYPKTMAPPRVPLRFLKATMVNNPDPFSHEELEDLRAVEEELTNIPGLKSYILPMETLKYDIDIQPIVAPAATMRMHLTSDQYVLLCHYQAVLRTRLGYVNKADYPDFSHFKLPPKPRERGRGRGRGRGSMA